MSARLSDDSAPPRFGALEHVTEAGDERPATCTIFPRNCSDDQLVTRWITAEETAFVSLDRIR